MPLQSQQRHGGGKSEALVLSQAGEFAVKSKDLAAKAKATSAFVEKHCKSDVSEEWKKADKTKIAKLRGILDALREEKQSTQLLKRESAEREVAKTLEVTRKSVEKRLARCKEREELFVEKQAKLRLDVRANEKLLSELEATIEKGKKKADDEKVELRRLEQEARDREVEFHECEEARAAEQRKIDRILQYKTYLERVVYERQDLFKGEIDVLMNRCGTLEARNVELHDTGTALSAQLERTREEHLRERTNLQNDHLMTSSRLHECQVALERHRAESQDLEQRLSRELEEKELKESQIGVIQMAIEQLFVRALSSCRLKQSRDAMQAIDTKFAPVRGDRDIYRLQEMLAKIAERFEDLHSMHQDARSHLQNNEPRGFNPDQDNDILGEVHFAHGDLSGPTGRSALRHGQEVSAALSSATSSKRISSTAT